MTSPTGAMTFPTGHKPTRSMDGDEWLVEHWAASQMDDTAIGQAAAMDPRDAKMAKQDTERLRESQGNVSSYVRSLFMSVLEETAGAEMCKKVMSILEESEHVTESHKLKDLQTLRSHLDALGLDESVLLASALSNMLNLENCAENVMDAFARDMEQRGMSASGPEDTTYGVVAGAIANGVKPEAIYEALCNQTVDLVFTAHPTQALRRSLLKCLSEIRSKLFRLLRERMSHIERLEAENRIKSLIQSAWRTDEIQRSKPTPQDEMRGGLAYFHEQIFKQLPVFIRRTDAALKSIGMPRLPLSHVPIRFSSWMAGDRDGNPFVTSETTREVIVVAQTAAVNLYRQEVESLMFALSMWRCSPELKERVDGICGDLEAYDEQYVTNDRKKRNYADFWQPIPATEPYRVLLSQIRDRLYNTREYLHCKVRGGQIAAEFIDNAIYTSADELFEPLKMCYDSLKQTGDEAIADGKVLDLLRQVKCFGLSLFKTDIRQESERHADAMDAITTWLGLGSFKSWSEEERVAWLVKELESRRPLVNFVEMDNNAEVKEVLDTFRMIADVVKEHPDSLGTYVISMATSASDVLTVKLLMRESGVPRGSLLKVAPLFERLQDLQNAPKVMRTLYSNAWYLEHCKSVHDGWQEVMIGYSDSGKDAGRMAAAWALFEAQEAVTAVGNEFGIRTTLFHGRGGTVGRGGGPSNLAIMSQPPRTINGSLRVTIQGEVIEQCFGHDELSLRTMDLFTAATLHHTLEPPKSPKQEWRDMMAKLSVSSCAQYRKVVFQTPHFGRYLQQATPASELGRMNIGSRPSKRNPNAGVESLRAIPWIFAWTQVSFHLPVWLGIGTAFKEQEDSGALSTLREMYNNWPFFRVTLDMLEMVLAKSNSDVARMYKDSLVDGDLQDFGNHLFDLYDETVAMMLKVMKTEDLLGADDGAGNLNRHALLQARLQLRKPYIIPLNLLQIHCLKELRNFREGEEKPQLYEPRVPMARELLQLNRAACDTLSATEDTLQIAMKGIAAGQGNTG